MFPELETQIQDELTTMFNTQEVFFNELGRYQRLPLVEKDKYSFEVHQYTNPNHDHGYSVIFRRTYYNKDYTRTVGYGPEANSRTQDWVEVINDIE